MIGAMYKILKKNKFLYFLKYRMDPEYRNNKRLMKNTTFKTPDAISREMKVIEKYWGCPALHYVRYGLFGKDLSEEQLLDYIPPYYFYNYYLPKQYSGMNISPFADKLSMYRHFRACGINTPDVLFAVEKGAVRTCTAGPADDLYGYMKERPQCKYFIKPADGRGGHGINIITFSGKDVLLNKKPVYSTSDIVRLLDARKTYVVQAGLCQREDISEINASSVNTLRVITQIRDGKNVMPVCVMRMGRNNSDVDNSAQGGLSVEIDTVTGAFAQSASGEHGTSGRLKYDAHPDSGFVFAGKSIRDWNFIKEQILSAAGKLPGLSDVAWDIAITEGGGISVVEINFYYGIDHLQCVCGGMRQRLGVFPDK